MKVRFDGPLKAQDTVLMNLYKRVYPKWTYTLKFPLPSHWGRGDGDHEAAIKEEEEMT